MLKLLAFGLVFYYVIWPLIRFMFKGYIITQVHRFNSEQVYRQKQAQQKKEGTIDVDYVPPKSSSKSSKPKADDGDYVPYEEIKD
jgi:hypothetical protein